MRLFRGINKPQDIETVDADSFRFGGPMKALFYKLLQIINPPPQEWLDRMGGNQAVLRDIYYEYLGHEGQTWRRENLIRGIPFLLCLMEDTNYEEVANWFLFRICQEYEKCRFTFTPTHIIPDCWYRDGRGRRLTTKEENLEFIQTENEKWLKRK